MTGMVAASRINIDVDISPSPPLATYQGFGHFSLFSPAHMHTLLLAFLSDTSGTLFSCINNEEACTLVFQRGRINGRPGVVYL